VHFLVLSAKEQEGWLEIHEDTNSDGVYQGDQDPRTEDSDKMIVEGRISLPQFVHFERAPACISFQPSGYLTPYNSGGGLDINVQASSFDKIMNDEKPVPVGEIILGYINNVQPYKVCMDLDRAAGKVRRHFFLSVEK
jgi:hypothetical protein